MRRLNNILQQSETYDISFQELSELLQEIFDGNVYVASKKGKILGHSFTDLKNASIEKDENDEYRFSEEYNNELMKINSTLFNITKEDLLQIFKDDIESYDKYVIIVPIIGRGNRLGTLVISKNDQKFGQDDLALAEYAATVVGLEILKSEKKKNEEERRKIEKVKMAIGTLSYSEVEAIEHIFKALDGEEGLLVASKVADRVGITRSVIVNALRKFESAGVIESRSLGMKGTYIKILNDKLLEEFNKIKENYSF